MYVIVKCFFSHLAKTGCLNDLLKDAFHRDFDIGEHMFKDQSFLVAVDDIGIENLRRDCLEIIIRYHLQVGELQAILWGVENQKSDGLIFFIISHHTSDNVKYANHILAGLRSKLDKQG